MILSGISHHDYGDGGGRLCERLELRDIAVIVGCAFELVRGAVPTDNLEMAILVRLSHIEPADPDAAIGILADTLELHAFLDVGEFHCDPPS